MTRSFGAVDIVQLPRLGVADAIVLGTALITWADSARPLPVPLRKPVMRLRKKLDELRDVAMDRVEEAAVSSTLRREIDRVLDAAWSAAYSWSTGWAKLPDRPELSQSAEMLQGMLFADGLKFTQLRYHEQWVESQARLDLIAQNRLDEHFARLGGQPILATIRRAHARYGEALRLTSAKKDDRTSPREALRAFLVEMRRYVVQVSAYEDPDDITTIELADKLLEPLKTWKPRPAAEPAETPAEPEPGSDTEPMLAASDPSASSAEVALAVTSDDSD